MKFSIINIKPLSGEKAQVYSVKFEDKYEVDPDNFFIVNDTYIISNLSYAIKFWREQNPKRITTSSYEVETFKDVELEPYKDSKKYNI